MKNNEIPREEILPDQIAKPPISKEVDIASLDSPVLINPTIIGGHITNAEVTRYVKVSTGVLGVGDPNRAIFIGSQNDGFSAFGEAPTRSIDIAIISTSAGTRTSVLYSPNCGLYAFGTDMEFSVMAKFSSIAGYQDGYLGVGTWSGGPGATLPLGYDNAAWNVDHVGFIIYDSLLWISTGDGAADTYTQITGITLTNWNYYKIVFDAGVSAKFYINDVLVGTHTTNLPNSTNPALVFGITDRDVDTVRSVSVFNNYSFEFDKP